MTELCVFGFKLQKKKTWTQKLLFF